MNELPSDAPAAGPSARESRLDSWKEIAAYLRRDVSTVQRWERREGMPVHRHLHDKQGSVYALRTELDAWAHGRKPAAVLGGVSQTAATLSLRPTEAAPPSPPSPPRDAD